jgi:hypothetical protein
LDGKLHHTHPVVIAAVDCDVGAAGADEAGVARYIQISALPAALSCQAHLSRASIYSAVDDYGCRHSLTSSSQLMDSTPSDKEMVG